MKRPLLLVVLCSLLVGEAECARSSEFSDLLISLTNEGLNANDMQAYIDQNVQYHKSSSINGKGFLNEISVALSKKFANSMDITRSIKNYYEKNYETLPDFSEFHDCCNPSRDTQYTYSEHLRGYVDFNSICYVGVGSKKTRKHFDRNFIKLLKQNHERKGNTAKWQYIGTEDGVLHIYPASNSCIFDGEIFDPRYRPWYVEAASPKPKDVVIVLDKSNSMGSNSNNNGNTYMYIAREAAKTVIETLNPNDKVGIVAFSDDAEIPIAPGIPGCYKNILAQGTPENKKNLKKLIDVIKALPHGGTNYVPALNKAFDLLSSNINTTINGERDAAILFLTDGIPKEEQYTILNNIQQRNSEFSNKVIILTFGIGDALGEKATDILTKMALQKEANQTYGKVRAGKFTSVPNTDDLRDVMGIYYEFFASSACNRTIISVPYIDGFALGLVTSICSPLMTGIKSILQGIACVDISLSSLLGQAANFQPTELTYAFIVDKYGRMMTHPLLPKIYDFNEAPLFVDMLEIERSPEAKDILASMLRGESGNKTFVSDRILSRGDSIHDGVNVRRVKSEYFWTKKKKVPTATLR